MATIDKEASHHFHDRSKIELIRQREVFKYASSILSNIVIQQDNGPAPFGLQSASDNTTLTAFAQLCVCQTGTARCLISLFDVTYQYIVAEATPALPLVPGIPHADILLCGNAFPRRHGICEGTLFKTNEIPGGSNNGLSEIPVVVIPNLMADASFNAHSKPCAIGDPKEPTRFYASAPIQTAKGVNIGVICVMSPQPIYNWSDAQSQILRNISYSIMRYLEGNRTIAHSLSERMNKGIFAFMEENFNLAGSRLSPKAADLANLALPSDFSDSVSDDPGRRQTVSSQKTTLSSSNSSGVYTQPTPVSEFESDHDMGSAAPVGRSESPDPIVQSATISNFEARSETLPKSTVELIFSNAAEKIRQATDTEGCFFLNAAPASFGALRSLVVEDPIASALGSSSTSSDDSTDSSSGPPKWLPARVLGFSTSERHGVDRCEHLRRHAGVTEKLLRTLVKRYPRGKLFTFHTTYGLDPTDSSEEDRLRNLSTLQNNSDLSRSEPGRQRQQPQTKAWARQNEGRDILRIFPGARNVAFVPIWDSKKNRWYAGGFIYSRQPTRTFTAEGELTYLRVFGILALTETLRHELILDERAKFDALSSLSHELRSPLHGIILGIEMLTDTNLSTTQGDIIHTLEACGRTLSDTFNHLLDYAKVNNFQTTRTTLARGIHQDKLHSIKVGMTRLTSSVQIDLLTEEVMESIFAGFTFQYMSISQLKKLNRAQDSDIAANLYLDSLRAKEDLCLEQSSQTAGVAFKDILVLFDADPEFAWTFDTQPGAIRRIVMNLFGNALKYTQKGIIKVVLEQRAPKKDGANRERQVTITVSDTGSGIGEDFLRNQLFRPFSQENSLAPGIGLGLSLVKRMTSKLRGRISVQSQVGVGTSISVTLPLSVPPSVPGGGKHHDLDDVLYKQRMQLSGLRIRLLGFDHIVTLVNGESHDSHAMIGNMCRNWLGLEVHPKTLKAPYFVPDFVLASEDALGKISEDLTLSKLPCVVVSVNALVAYRRSTQRNEHPEIVEFISQPVGPRKLAKAMLLSFDRWSVLQAGGMSSGADSSSSWMTKSKMDQHELESKPSTTSSTQFSTSDNADIRIQSTPPVELVLRPKLLKPPSNRKLAAEFLLVEDNPINLRILSTYMKKLRLGFNTATNGLQALEAYKRSPSECKYILTDVSMPVMDGFEATRQIRAHERAAGLAPATIIALTGLASSESQTEAFTSGMDLFLTKPVKLKELEGILKSKGILK